MDLSTAKIIITGAAAGFGKAMAVFFANLGATVFALDVNENALNTLKSEYSHITILPCDLTDNIQVEETIGRIFNIDRKVNVLINNAGIMKNAPLINLLNREDKKHSIELWHQVMNINLHAVFYTSRMFAEQMVKNRNKGVIINISSIAAQGNVGQTAYSASKAALEAMTKVWAKELGSFGIRSVAVAPGFIDTSGTHDALEETMLAQWVNKTPLRRTGTIDEVVTTIRFVIENEFVNGTTISTNGGLTL